MKQATQESTRLAHMSWFLTYYSIRGNPAAYPEKMDNMLSYDYDHGLGVNFVLRLTPYIHRRDSCP